MTATADSDIPAGPPGAAPDGASWFVVHTKPRQEALAREHLLRQSFEVYLPMFKVFKAPRRGRAGSPAAPDGSAPPAQGLTTHEPMFPRYLFLRPGRPTQSMSTIRSTQGVSRLVLFGSQPARIAQELVDGIRQAEVAREGADLAQLSPYRPGMAVRLQDPALGGLQALVQAVSHDRVTLLLEILGRPQLVSVDFQRIAPL